MKNRALRGDADALRLHQFLIDTYPLVEMPFNWDTRHWEDSYWSVSDAERNDPNWGAHTQIWETAGGQIMGAAIPDGPGDVALQVHPHHRDLEDEILDWSEIHIAHPLENGQRELIAWAFDWDTERQARLQRRGHAPRSEWFWHNRRRTVSDPVPDLPVPEGYIIRSVCPTEADVERWSACSNATFRKYYSSEYHRNFQLYSPSHNYDLHLIAETPDGSFVTFVGLTVDAHNRFAIIEPVGTHPDHRRKGLARLVIFEGIRRLQALGTTDFVYVANWGTSDAAKLYASAGLELDATLQAWVKTF